MKRLLIRVLLLVVAPVAALIWGADYYVAGIRYVTTDNAYVKSHVVAISAEVPGRVATVSVADNKLAKKGDLLFAIDPEPYKIMFRKAEAELGRVRNTIAAMRADYAQAYVERAEAKQNIRYFERVFERQKTLSRKGIASRAKYEEAERNLANSRQRADALTQKLLRILANLGGRVDLPVKQHPDYLEAKADRDDAELNLRRTKVYAPASGVIGRVTLQPGEYVKAGTPVFPLVQTGEQWIEANLKETQLTYLRVGQKATIVLDAYPNHVWPATVKSISPSTGAEFSILPPQNASGNWVKVVQRVPVRLAIDAKRPGIRLRSGMTVSVRIDTERKNNLVDMIGSAFAWTTGRK